eukprot:TRINITY_DN5969_c0_g1_i1.p1 TRINITY_DN5969_c0_g1~~TRINITY_DN5969_c0_g1_i1.p1  ORF type:complete len:472 (+),score=247.14 TRINITY_DN5969_c0_g1_i1:177-1418(+)
MMHRRATGTTSIFPQNKAEENMHVPSRAKPALGAQPAQRSFGAILTNVQPLAGQPKGKEAVKPLAPRHEAPAPPIGLPRTTISVNSFQQQMAAPGNSINIFQDVIRPSVAPSKPVAFIADPEFCDENAIPMEDSFSNMSLEDIDDEDREFPVCVVEYIDDIMSNLKRKEIEDSIPSTFLDWQNELRPVHFSLLLEWMEEVYVALNLLPETFTLSIHVLQRVLSTHQVSKKKLQLLALSSILVAAKFEEEWAPPIEDLLYTCDNSFELKEILKMESSVLTAINFNLTAPLPIHFYRRYSKAGRLESKPHTLGKYLSEIAFTSMSTLKYAPSLIAAASVMAARRFCRVTPDWSSTLTHYTGYTRDQVIECAVDLMKVAYTQCEKEQKGAIFRKYQKSNLLSVSMIPSSVPRHLVL